MDHVVVDVEIQRAVGDGGLTWNDTDKMGVAVAVLYEHRNDRFKFYGPSDVEKLRERLEAADRISGFNILRFDLPVIYGLAKREQPPEALKLRCDDIFLRIQLALQRDPSSTSIARWHKGWSLDITASGTLGRGKIEAGKDAPVMFQNGEFARLHQYCLDDVSLERDLAAFIDRFGYVVNGITGQRVAISPWSPQK